MNFSEFTARLLLIFLPGIICVRMIGALCSGRERKLPDFVIDAFVFGVVCYTVYGAIWKTLHVCFSPATWLPDELHILNALSTPPSPVGYAEIFWTTLLSVPIALVYTVCHEWKLLHRFAKACHISNKFGDADVWGYLFNSPVVWVVVRDIPNDTMYSGWVMAYSDTEAPRELLLGNVRVFRNSSAALLYEVDSVYLSRKNEEWSVEIPSPQREEKQCLKETKTDDFTRESS